MLIVLAIAILTAAAIVSVLGQGGGALYTPIQVWIGISFHEAAATSLFLIMAMSLSSSLVYRKANRIDWALAIAIESGSVSHGRHPRRHNAAPTRFLARAPIDVDD